MQQSHVALLYTVRQKKGTNFLLGASLLILDRKLVNFFVDVKESTSCNAVYLILACVKNFAY